MKTPSVAFPVALLWLVALAACGSPAPQTEPVPTPDPFAREEAAVIRAAIDQLYPDASVRVIQSGTGTTRGDASGLRSHLSALVNPDPELLDSYVIRNARPLDLRSMMGALSASRPVRVVTRQELDLLPGRNPDAYWHSFYTKYPNSGGLITVTRPGFSADGATALMYIGRACGGRCGAFGYAVLRKEHGRWILKDHRIDTQM